MAGTNHATLINGATYASGKSGQAFSFDGVDDYVQVGSSASLVLTNNFSLEAWIYPKGLGMILGKEGEYLIARAGSGTLQYVFANTSPGWAWYDTGISVAANQWTHLAVVYNNGRIASYTNGSLAHTFNGSGIVGDADTSQNDFRIGGRQGESRFFNGLIDEVGVYSRDLSSIEIAILYAAGSAGKCYTTTPRRCSSNNPRASPATC